MCVHVCFWYVKINILRHDYCKVISLRIHILELPNSKK